MFKRVPEEHSAENADTCINSPVKEGKRQCRFQVKGRSNENVTAALSLIFLRTGPVFLNESEAF